MARELILDVVARKDGKQLSALAAEFDRLATKTEVAGKKFSTTTSLGQALDVQLAKARKTVADLGTEIDKTGRVDMLPQLRSAQRDVRQLEGIKRTLSAALGAAGDDSGKVFGNRFTNALASNRFVTSVGNALGGVSGIWSVAGPLLVAGAPAIGVGIGGALLTGIATAGIGAGIASQLRDPALGAAMQKLGQDAGNEFRGVGSSFRAPMLVAIHDVDAEFKRLGPGLRSTFDKLAPSLVNLERGATGFVDKLAPGLERAAVAGAPLVDLFGRRLPQLGADVGAIFDVMARHSGQAAQGLNLLINITDLGLKQVGLFVDEMSKLWSLARLTTGTLAIFADAGSKGGKSTDDLDAALQKAAADLAAFNSGAKATTQSAYDMSNALATAFGATMDVDQASIQWKADLAGLKGALDLSNKTLDTNTASGRQNAQALLQMAQDAERTREAAIAMAGGQNASSAAVSQANAKFRSQIGQLEALATALGLSKAQVQALLDKYKALAAAPNIVKHITVATTYTSSGKVAKPGQGGAFLGGLAHGGVMYAAAKGMIYPASNVPLVKFAEPETGGEAYIPRRGIAAAAGLALANTAASWYGGAVVPRGGGWGGGVPTVRIVVEDTSGRELVNRIIRFAQDTGRTPAALFPNATR